MGETLVVGTGTNTHKDGGLDLHRIFELLPHRYPFLLVDRVIESIPGQRLVALKNVTVNEPFFAGHFPDRPVMPGVLVLEAMVQASSLLARESFIDSLKTLHFLVGVDKAKFRSPVVPGDQLILSANLTRVVRRMARFRAEARVGNVLVASAGFLCTSVESDD